jgi:beta-lactamase regulating signal transducer with metallopeptidase domain/HEAT repeat protein
MHPLSVFGSSPISAIGLRWLVESAVSASLLFGVAGLAHVALRRSGAAWRHLLWAATLTGALLVPAASALGPRLAMPGGKAPTWLTQPASPSPSVGAKAPDRATASEAARNATGTAKASGGSAPSGSGAAAMPAGSFSPSRSADAESRPWLAGRALAVWCVGVIAVLVPWVLARAALQRVARRSERVRGAEWLVLAEEAAHEVGLSRPFVLLQSDEVEVPMTWGVLSPRVVLPRSASEWTVERRRAVLMHELAHVKRHDCLSQFLAQAACAIYWFHPAAWMAARQLRVERERACDDLVLLSRTRASDYADHLLDVVRSLRNPGPSALGAVAFARPSQFEGRLLAVLDPRRRRDALRGAHAWRVGLAVLVASAALATLRPWTIGPALAGGGNGGHRSVWVHGAVGRVGGVREPSDVLVAPVDAGGLEQRWQWAVREAGRRDFRGPVWVGYALPDRADADRGYATDTDGFDWGMLDENDSRLKLRTVLQQAGAEQGVNDVAMLLRVTGPDPRPEDATRLRAQNVTFGAELEKRPLLWLGRVSDAESAEWLISIEPKLASLELRRVVLDMLSIHRTADRILPVFDRYARSDAPEELRASAVEGLGQFPTEASQALLVELARHDGSPRVRREAVEALGRMGRSDAADELVSIARDTHTPDDVRRHAIEAIEQHLDDGGPMEPAKDKTGDKHKDKHKAPESQWSDGSAETTPEEAKSDRLADSQDEYDGSPAPGEMAVKASMEANEETGDLDVQRQAVESLGRYPAEIAVPRLRAVLRSEVHSDLRRQAVETLGRIDSDEARKVVTETLWKDRHPDVMRQAVESLSRAGDPAAPLLAEVARRHPVSDVRCEAVEDFRHCSQSIAVRQLVKIIHESDDADVQRRAVETLARFEGPEVVTELQSVIRSHPNNDVRRQAVESLSRMDPELALPVLEELLAGRKSRH